MACISIKGWRRERERRKKKKRKKNKGSRGEDKRSEREREAVLLLHPRERGVKGKKSGVRRTLSEWEESLPFIPLVYGVNLNIYWVFSLDRASFLLNKATIATQGSRACLRYRHWMRCMRAGYGEKEPSGERTRKGNGKWQRRTPHGQVGQSSNRQDFFLIATFSGTTLKNPQFDYASLPLSLALSLYS